MRGIMMLPMSAEMKAPRVWRLHHCGGLTFRPGISSQSSGERFWLSLPWTGKRVEIVADQEEMRGRLREVGFNEGGVEGLMTWLFGISTKATVPVAELVESLV